MKKIALLIVITLLSACANNDDKARELLKEYLFETLDNYNSYEPISFTALDSVYSDYTMDSTYIEATKLYDICCKRRESILSSLQQDKSTENINEYVHIVGYTTMIYPNICDSIKNNYLSYFVGFEMEHSYRAKTRNGSSVLYHKQIIFNKDLNDVLMVIDLAENTKLENSTAWENGNTKKSETLKKIELKYADKKSQRDTFFEKNKNIKDMSVLSPTVHIQVLKEGAGGLIQKNEEVLIRTHNIIDGIPQKSVDFRLAVSDCFNSELVNFLITQKKRNSI